GRQRLGNLSAWCREMHFAPSCSTPASCRWQCSYLASGPVGEPALTGKAKVGTLAHGGRLERAWQSHPRGTMAARVALSFIPGASRFSGVELLGDGFVEGHQVSWIA